MGHTTDRLERIEVLGTNSHSALSFAPNGGDKHQTQHLNDHRPKIALYRVQVLR